MNMKSPTMLVAMLLFSILLTACGGLGNPADTTDPNDPTGDPATSNGADVVTIGFAAQEFERATYAPLIEAFNAENPDIQVQFISPNEISGVAPQEQFDPDQMMRRMVTAADTASAFFVRDEDIQQGLLYDMAPLMEADPSFDRDDFFPGALNVQEDGGIYLLPQSLSIPLLSYNQELWTAGGLDTPEPDWSWNDLLAAAEQIAGKRGDEVDVYGFMTFSSGFVVLLAQLDQAGVNLFSTPMDQMQLDQPEIVAALERVKALAESGAIYVPDGENPEAFDSEEVRELIMNERLGIWQAPLLEMGGNVIEPAFTVGTTALPPLNFPFFSNTQGLVMSSGTQHPQAAWRWLEFLSRQQLEQRFGMGGVSEIPARRSVAEQSGYWDDLDEETAAAVRAVLERPIPPLPEGVFSNQYLEILSGAVASVLSGDASADEALAEAQAQLTERVAEMQLTPEPTPDTGPIVVATPVPDDAPAGATTITFGVSEFQAGDMRRIAREYNQNNPDVFVEIANINFADGPPDFGEVAASSDCFVWSNLPETEELTATLDLQPLIDADAAFSLNDYPAAFLTPFRSGTRLYGLPYAVNLQTLNYNQDAFDVAGLAYPTAAWTLDDFVNAAQQLTIDAGGTEQYGFVSVASSSQNLFFFLDRLGVSLVQGSGESLQPDFTNPEVVAGIRFYMDLIENYSPHDGMSGYRQGAFNTAPFQLLNDGQVGMWLTTGSLFFMSGNEADFTQAIAPPPLGASGITPNDFFVQGLYISATTDQPELCWNWLKYFSEQTELVQGGLPARMSVIESDAYTAEAEPGAVEVYMAYREALERTPDVDISQSYQQMPIDFFWLFQAVDRAMQGEDLEQELVAAQTLTEEFLACVRDGAEAEFCAPQVDHDYAGSNQPDESSDT